MATKTKSHNDIKLRARKSKITISDKLKERINHMTGSYHSFSTDFQLTPFCWLKP